MEIHSGIFLKTVPVKFLPTGVRWSKWKLSF